MAQTNYTPISLYYSTTAAATPSAGNLVAGELALNTTDEKLYFKNTGGTVKQIAGSGVGGVSYTAVKTANYTAANNDGVLTNTTGGAFTVTLPTSPSVGNIIVVVDSFSQWGTNNLTIDPTALIKIANNTAGDTLVCDITGVSVTLVYTGASYGWNVAAQVGGNGGTAVTLTGVQTLTNKTLTAPTIASANLTTALTLAGAAGTNGQVLTSAGSGLPSWTTPAGGFSTMQVFTSSGTFTIPSGKTTVKVTVVGAGGGGGGGTGGTSGGGGSGAAGISYLTTLTPANTISVTIGAAGTAGAGSGTGGTGGTSSIQSGTQTISTISATGGIGGVGAGSGASGGLGGTCSGATFNITGGVGDAEINAGSVFSGSGGNSIYGGSGMGGTAASANGQAGTNGGGGGGGRFTTNGSAGGSGIVIFEY